MNFPTTHPCYQGVQWNERRQNEALARADVVLVIDSDVPWIGAVSQPRDGARIFHIDADPLKQQMPLWYIGAALQCQADAALALRQIRAASGEFDAGSRKTRAASATASRPRTSLAARRDRRASSRATSSLPNTWWPAFATPSAKTPSWSASR